MSEMNETDKDKDAAKRDAIAKYKTNYNPKVDELIGYDCGFDAGYAAAATPWREIAVDGLPTEDGNYVVETKTGVLVVSHFCTVSLLDEELWNEYYAMYQKIQPFVRAEEA